MQLFVMGNTIFFNRFMGNLTVNWYKLLGPFQKFLGTLSVNWRKYLGHFQNRFNTFFYVHVFGTNK